METETTLYDNYKNDKTLVALIEKKVDFISELNEYDKPEIVDNFDNDSLIEDISTYLVEKTISEDAFTDYYGIVCDKAARLILDDYYDDLKDKWAMQDSYEKDPAKHFGVSNKDFFKSGRY